MYCKSGALIPVPVSLSLGGGTLTSHPVLFVFKYNTTDTNTSTQQLVIGAAKTSLGKKPKSEYVIETLQGNPNDTKCFTVDPMKVLSVCIVVSNYYIVRMTCKIILHCLVSSVLSLSLH